MKQSFYVIILTALLTLPACSNEAEQSPLSVVNKRMAAYNQHDLTAFLATYAEDVQIYTYPDKHLTDGKAELQSIFEPMFNEAFVKVTIHHQIEKDSYVTNHETVEYPNATIDYVSIYKVVNSLITEVRFVRD